MGRYYTTAIIFILYCYLVSCSFDPPNETQLELGNNYFVSIPHETSRNDGIKIVYSIDRKLYQVLASNCEEVYMDSAKIVFSKSKFVGDKNIEYFLINKNIKKQIQSLNKSLFEKQILKMKKIIINQTSE